MGRLKNKKKQKIIDKNKIKETLKEAKEMSRQNVLKSGVEVIEIFNQKKIKKQNN
jgi:hypothetical protein